MSGASVPESTPVALVHLRLVSPPDLADRVLESLEATLSVCNIVRVPGAARRPDGDLILADVAREDASAVVGALRELGLAEHGSISVEEVETALSAAAQRAERAAAGAVADAVVWEEVEARTSESAELSFSFLSFMVIATLLAGVGVLTDSQILIIGAMVVGPEFGPIAGFCVAAVERRRALAARSIAALGVGFPVAIAATFLFTLFLRATELAPTPDELTRASHPATLFISQPNRYSLIVAILAGVAGIISLTTAKSGALLGVLISVATIPAAGNLGVALAYGDWRECAGAAAQLGINLAALIGAGIATLAVQRLFFARRRDRVAERSERRLLRRRRAASTRSG